MQNKQYATDSLHISVLIVLYETVWQMQFQVLFILL